MRIGIGNDHAAIQMKYEIVNYLIEKGISVVDYGIGEDEKIDYPLMSETVCEGVLRKEVDCGILICGTGIGVSIAANKMDGIRAAVCSEPYSAKLSKQHNDTNVLCFGARVIGVEMAKMIVDAWLEAEFEKGRHQERVKLIERLEK